MAKRFRFRFRISRVIPFFQSCRSKDPSTLPSNPDPLFLRRAPSNTKFISSHFSTITPSPTSAPPPSKHRHSSLRSHMSSAIISIGCGLTSRATLSDEDPDEPRDFQWEKEDQWHVIAKVYDNSTPRRKIYNSSASGVSDSGDDDVLPLPRPSNVTRKKGRVKKKKTTSRIRISTSSADSYGLFSSDGYDERDVDEEETETLVSSSRSFSTDSSCEFNPHLETIRETPSREGQRRKHKQKKTKCRKKETRRSVSIAAGTRKKSLSSPECVSPARLSMFQRLIPCRVEGKVRESFAVVKKSDDPYQDFKRSMMEMILEKQMFEEKDLEQLLHCFLSLNSSKHHGLIVEAFAEIWEGLFCSRQAT